MHEYEAVEDILHLRSEIHYLREAHLEDDRKEFPWCAVDVEVLHGGMATMVAITIAGLTTTTPRTLPGLNVHFV